MSQPRCTSIAIAVVLLFDAFQVAHAAVEVPPGAPTPASVHSTAAPGARAAGPGDIDWPR